MTQHKLRENIAYVQQQAWLFSGTIAEKDVYKRQIEHPMYLNGHRYTVTAYDGCRLPQRVPRGIISMSCGQTCDIMVKMCIRDRDSIDELCGVLFVFAALCCPISVEAISRSLSISISGDELSGAGGGACWGSGVISIDAISRILSIPSGLSSKLLICAAKLSITYSPKIF